MFIGLLAGIAHAFDHAKCIFLNKQPGMTQPTLIIVHPNEYIQRLHHSSFAVN